MCGESGKRVVDTVPELISMSCEYMCVCFRDASQRFFESANTVHTSLVNVYNAPAAEREAQAHILLQKYGTFRECLSTVDREVNVFVTATHKYY